MKKRDKWIKTKCGYEIKNYDETKEGSFVLGNSEYIISVILPLTTKVGDNPFYNYKVLRKGNI